MSNVPESAQHRSAAHAAEDGLDGGNGPVTRERVAPDAFSRERPPQDARERAAASLASANGDGDDELLAELFGADAVEALLDAELLRTLDTARGVKGSGAGRERASASSSPRPPCVVIVDADAQVRATLSGSLGGACQTHEVEPTRAVVLLRTLSAVDVALVDCDQPPSAQAPIFQELARWPGAVCVLMSANAQKVEQLRALGVFAPLVLDKPLRSEALEAIRSATLELSLAGL